MAINFLNITETLVEARINDNTVGSSLPTPRLAFKENGVVSGGISTTGGNLILETSSGTERVRITTTGNAVFAGDISLADGKKLQLGAANDLQIYHDGSNSYINDTGTGNLNINATNLALNNGAGTKTYILATDGGSVQLRHNDSTKLESTSTGITVTGVAKIQYNGVGLDVENTASNGADTGIRIRGARNGQSFASGNLTSYALFSNYDDNTTPNNYDLAKIGAGMYDASADTGYFRIMTNNGTAMTKALDIDKSQNALFYANVGIGGSPATVTHNPHLDIVGNRGTLTVGTGYFEDNGSTNFLNGARPLAFGTGGTERMRINSSGFVGIGSNSPVAPLEVKSSETNHLTLYRPANTTEGNAGSMNFDGNDSDSNQQTYAKIESFTDDPTAGSHAGKISFSIAKGANGITSAMTIQKDAQVSLNQYGQGSYTGTAAYTLQVDSAGNIIEGSTSGGGTVTGSGAATRVAFWSGTSALSSNANLYWDNTNDRLGIGTTAPNETLSLYKSDRPYIQFISNTTGTTSSDGSFIGFANADGFLEIRNKEAQPIRLSTSDTERMRITSVGKVGIGTTSPASPLHIYQNGGDTSTGAGITIEQDGTGDAVVQYLLTGNRRWVAGVDNSDSDRFKFASSADVGTNTVVTINTSEAGGNVGIGTTSPTSKLNVYTSTGRNFEVDQSSSNVTTLKNDYHLRLQASGGYNLQFYTGASATERMVIDSSGDTTFAGDVTIGSSGAGSDKTLNILTGGSKSIVKLMEAGTVYGFSTLYDGATNKFHINRHSNSAAGTSVLSFNRDDDNATFAGNIEVNAEEVNIDSATHATLTLDRASTSYDNNIMFKTAADTKFRIWQDGDADYLYIRDDDNATNMVTFKKGGNVGIGTTSPTEKLHVEGRIRLGTTPVICSHDNIGIDIDQNNNSSSNYFRVTRDGEVTELFRVQENGNVGIGTSTPATELDIAKDIDAKLRITSTRNGSFVDGDNFGSLEFYGKDTSGLGEGIRAAIRAKAQGTYGIDTNLTFSTSNGSTGLDQERMRINSAGAIKFNNYDSTNNTGTPTYLLGTDGSGNIVKTLSTPGGIPTQHNLKSKAYTSLVGSPSSGSWFDIFTITDSMGPVNCKIFTYAHDALEFSVAEGYGPSNAGTITVINSVNTSNSGYATVSEVRIDQNGVVSIKLVWSSGPTVNIGISISGYNVPNLTSTLSVNTSTVTVVDSVNVDVTGIVRSRKQLRAGSNVLFDTSGNSYINGGNIGIGNTSPSFLLDLASLDEADPTDFIRFGANNGNSAGTSDDLGTGIVWKPNYTGYTKRSAGIVQIGEGNYFRSGLGFFTNGTANATTDWSERMRISMDGNVGIGTTDPTKKLTVKVGSANDDGIFIQDENGNIRTDLGLAGTAGAREGRIKLIDDAGNTNVQIHSDTTSYFNGGDVGIGTTSPDGKLTVSGTGISTEPTISVINTSSTTFNHSINAFTPNLTSGESNILVFGRAGSTKNSAYIGYRYSGTSGSNNNLLILGHWASDNLMTLSGDGKVGIGTGTTAASEKLDVNGNIHLSANESYISFNTSASSGHPKIKMESDGDFNFLNTAGSSLMRIENGGNVGIGTSSPGTKLQVGGSSTTDGSINIGGAYGIYNWTRSYVVSSSSIERILNQDGNALANGGAYRVTGHISGTGTDQSSKAVFWNQNGTWYCNVTAQSENSSNHIEFLVYDGFPSVKTYHTNGYTVYVWHERIELNEGAGTDNTRHYFGADAYMSQMGDDISMVGPLNANGSSGKVGIGTYSPTDKFQIDAPHSQLRLRDTDDTTFTQFSSSGGKLAIRQDSTTASHFWMNSSGNVGIGNSNPANKLSVNLTSSVALSSQPAVPLFVGNNGNSVDGRVFIDVKHDVIDTASAVGAGLRMQAGAVTTGTASYNSSLIFLQSAGPGSNTIHSAPKAIQFYVDNHDTAAGSGSNYSQYGDLAMTIAENTSVGIGTTSPGTVNGTAFGGVMLHVKGPSNIGRLVLEGAVQGTMLMNATGSTANKRLKFIQSKQNEFRMGKVSDSGTETTQLAIDDAGDVILQAAGKGLVLVSPNGTTYRLSVTNDGEIETTVV